MQTTLLVSSIVIIILLVIILIVLLKNSEKNDKDTSLHIDQKMDQLDTRIDQKLKSVEDRSMASERSIIQSLSTFQERIATSFLKQSESMERKLTSIDTRVSESLQDGFQKTNATFVSIVERLEKIDAAQKKIDSLSTNIVSLQDILTDKKARGAFGEVQLNQILSSIFGEKNDTLYQTQYTLPNRTRVDAVLFAPEPLGTLAIDSKFPLENYRNSINNDLDIVQRNESAKLFVHDCRKHIDDISSKYIIPGVTSDQAIMFVPAEAVFAYIHAYHPEIISYAQNKRVWLTSPTTLMSTLTTIQVILKNLEREKYAVVIHQQLSQLGEEFERYRRRWSNLATHIQTVSKDVNEINITSDKISRRFDSIANVDTESIE